MSKPAAIIAKLEDCPNWLDRTLVTAYWEADYFLKWPDPENGLETLFRFDTDWAPLQKKMEQAEIQSFTIITAFNPGSKQLFAQENLRRHLLLSQKLLPHCSSLNPSCSQSPEGTWQEPGYWAWDIDLETAVDIGTEFGQTAIIGWISGTAPALWWLKKV